MRILIVSQHFPPEFAATGRRAQELAASLGARGHDVTVLAGRPNHPAVADRYFCRNAAPSERAPEGYRVLRELRLLHARTRAIMLLESRSRETVVDAFRFGAHGVIFRDEPLETLAKSIHAVHQGQVWANSEHLGYLLDALTHALPLRVQDARGVNLLSKREEDVVRLVAEGLTNREISHRLRLSDHTVRNYLFKIFDKLGVSSRVELVLYCLQQRNSNSVELPL